LVLAPMAIALLAVTYAVTYAVAAEERAAEQAPEQASPPAPSPAPAKSAETPSEPGPAAEASPTAKPTTSPSENYKATKLIPKRMLRALLGCWQLDEQERWTVSRLDTSGAQVATTPMRSTKKRSERVPFPNQAKRAAIPATLMYDAKQDNFGFSTAPA
jgi:hypothetical protein